MENDMGSYSTCRVVWGSYSGWVEVTLGLLWGVSKYAYSLYSKTW